MSIYQEYCPQNLTPTVTNFEIADDRVPTPTSPCICGGGSYERQLLELLSLTQAVDAVEATRAVFDSISQNGKPVAYKVHNLTQMGVSEAAKTLGIHSSAIRKIG